MDLKTAPMPHGDCYICQFFIPEKIAAESIPAAGLPSYKYINALTDSGLDSLMRLKESYRPSKKLKLFTARPSNFPR